ncbi:MAG: hypothetical protein NVSMB66_4270 [Candidatus Doudnabacteria bacterium]
MVVMNKLMKYIRPGIFLANVLLAALIYLIYSQNFTLSVLLDIRLGKIYALITVFYLYLSLIATPLYKAFPKLPFKVYYLRARRSLGWSTFLFACLHVYFEFFKLLGGFNGLYFLTSKYYLAVMFGIISFLLIAALAGTSFDFAVKALGPNWKRLHQLVYLAGVLILVHTLMLGSDFIDLSKAIPTIFYLAIIFLLTLETIRLEAYLASRFPKVPRNIPAVVLAIMVLAALFYSYQWGGFAAHQH